MQEDTSTDIAQAALNLAAHLIASAPGAPPPVYIGNLAYAATEVELREIFKSYQIKSVSIPINPRTNRPIDYAFVSLATAQEASAAVKELSGKEILARKVSVQLARKYVSAAAKPADPRVPKALKRAMSPGPPEAANKREGI